MHKFLFISTHVNAFISIYICIHTCIYIYTYSGSEFYVVEYVRRAQLQLFIFARRNLSSHISDVVTSAENTGFLHIFPNKVHISYMYVCMNVIYIYVNVYMYEYIYIYIYICIYEYIYIYV
jgi:hypothetical protein